MSRMERAEIVAGEDGREAVDLFDTGMEGRATSDGQPADFARDFVHHGTVLLGLGAAKQLWFNPRVGRSGSTVTGSAVR